MTIRSLNALATTTLAVMLVILGSVMAQGGGRPNPGPPNPVPVLNTVAPSSAIAGGAGFILTATGTGFVSGSVIQWNGTGRTTTFVSSTQLAAAISASDIATAEIARVKVFSPKPGGGISNALTFSVNNVAPSPNALRPVSTTAGGQQFTLNVWGSGFVSSSVVRWNGTDRTTTLGSYGQPRATILSGDIAATGTAQVTVFNPAPGGGTSNAIPFLITQDPLGVIGRESVASDGTEANWSSGDPSSVSGDGRFVAFDSGASNLVPDDTNHTNDIFVRATCLGASTDCVPSTSRVSLGSGGTQADSWSVVPKISANGRFVAFFSNATNLIANDTNGASGVFLRDTCFGVPSGCTPSTILVSVGTDGSQVVTDPQLNDLAISADGRFVAFSSVLVRDTCLGALLGCTPSTIQVATEAGAGEPSISASGRYVAFSTFYCDSEGIYCLGGVHISDTCFGAAAGCVPSTLDVVPDQPTDTNTSPSISADGRFVAYVMNDEVYVSDTCLNAPGGCTPNTIEASVSTDGAEANYGADWPSLSADGRFVTFESTSSNLTTVCCAGSVYPNIFVRDTCIGGPLGCTPTTVWISWGILPSGSRGYSPAISADGHFVVFYSDWAWLVENDNNGTYDVFLAGTGR